MTRHKLSLLSRLAVMTVISATLGGCLSPFSDHAEDVHQAWARQARNAHRKWDRYVLGLDWDDPYHDWHDESYASGPSHH